MKKLSVAAAVIIAAFVMLSASALAAPAATLQMALSDVAVAEDDIMFTVDISIDVPSEPYASLDFNLVSSDSGALSIAPKNPENESGGLDITFAEGYGSAYHNGRFDGDVVRYLLGIYGRTSGNVITDATGICSVRMKYAGDAAQTLSVSDLKLVYKNPNGAIVSSPVTAELPSLDISRDSLLLAIEDEKPPLSNGLGGLGALQISIFILLLAIGVTALLYRRKRARQ